MPGWKCTDFERGEPGPLMKKQAVLENLASDEGSGLVFNYSNKAA